MMLKVAYLSPLPPQRSGIADYSARLLPYLAEKVELVVYANDLEEEGSFAGCEVRPLLRLHDEWWRYDRRLYHMGNSLHHDAIYMYAMRYSGTIMLHDYGLHHLIADRVRHHEDRRLYLRELVYAYGQDGAERYWRTRGAIPENLFDNPLNRRLLESSLGVLTHSDYVRHQVQSHVADLPVSVVPFLDMTDSSQSVVPFSKASFNVSADTVVLASAGQITQNKQIDMILRLLVQLRRENLYVHYLIIGEPMVDLGLEEQIVELGLEGVVTQIGFVDDYHDFLRWIKTADIILNLRYPTIGETSAVVFQALALGRPTVVFNHGWYSEIDRDACVHVPVMDEESLLEEVRELVRNLAKRREIGRAARQLIVDQHQPDVVAEAYRYFLTEQSRRAWAG